MMFQDISQIFGRLGLKRPDVHVLMACLHHKDGLFVHEICATTKINRSTVYLSLKRLLAKNYISALKVGGRYKYFAEKPDAIIFQQEQLLEDLLAIKPILSKLGSQTGETEIRFFEGVAGIKQIYRDRLLKTKFSRNQEILSFSSGHDITKLVPEFESLVVRQRIKQRIGIRVIAPENSKSHSPWKNNKTEMRSVKYFDEKSYPFSVSLEIYGDSVAIYSPSKPVGGVIIRNAKISNSLRSLFNLVWALLP